MVRLPIPGSDQGQWGTILNDYLSVVHQGDGTLKPGVVSEANLDTAALAKLNNVGTIPDGSITEAKLAPVVQATIDGKIDADDLAAVATTGDYTDLINKPVISAPGVVAVTVTTGSEARPSGATTVLWLGGETEPVNMTSADLWFTAESITDTTAPSVPTSLAADAITPTSFTLSWQASTDDIAVTGYEVELDGVSYGIVSGTSVSITGRTANTTYSCTVRARDAAGNWSGFSGSIDVTTDVSLSSDHTVFGSTTYPGLLPYTENPYITVATAFYSATSRQVKGARLYIPAGTSVESNCTVYLFAPAAGLEPNLATASQTAVLPLTSGQWNEVDFPSLTTVTGYQEFWIGYMFSDGTYLSTSSVGAAIIAASDGSSVYMSGDNTPNGKSRNYFRVGTGATDHSTVSGQGYGVDVIMSEL